jgi:hypothetical protein
MSKFIIEIRTKGFTQAKKGFEDIEKSSNKATNAKNRQRQATAGLRRQVGALRNNLLLVSFATVGLTKALGGFVNASRKFEDVKTRLVGLTGSIKNAEVAFEAFNKVAATTPFMLDDVVNAGAQLQAFGLNAEATLESVTDLAAFMGTNATEAANALGRAFAGGAGAADILRERGILNIIKTTQGLDDLSKTTLPQFRQALLKTLVDPASGIEGSSKRMSKTLTGAMSNMQDAITRFQAKVGDLLTPTLMKAVQATEAFFRAIDLNDIMSFTRHVTALGVALTIYNAKAIIAMTRTINFSKALRASAVGALAFAISKLLEYSGAFASNTAAVNTNSQAVQQAGMNMNQYISTLGQSNIVLERNNELQKIQGPLLNKLFLINAQNLGMDDQRLKTSQLIFDTETLLTQAFGDRLTFQKGLSLQNQELNFTVTDLKEGEAEFLQVITDGFQIQKQNITLNKDMAMSSQQLGSAFSQVGNNLRALSQEGLSAEKKFAILLKTLGTVLSLTPGTAAGGGAISAFASLFAHTGGLIKNNGIQRFATGGMVQGQDNIPIMAQAGEFVMQRSAVNSIGLQNLAQMNNTGQPSGGVTINIAGDMVGDEDHVRTKVLPAIKEELRREALA